MYRKYFKRLMDVIVALFAIVFLLPLLIVIALLVRVKLGSPILFKQERPGKGEKIFELYKFRTMTDERDEDGNLLPDEIRLTKFGRMLRTTSLDELPELINIIKGDMSIIGPRPLLVKYLPFYSDTERRRHEVLPGLSGWAQVNGRNTINWEEKFAYDIEYIDNLSLLFDCKIVILTLKKVFAREDVLSGAEQIPDLDVERKM